MNEYSKAMSVPTAAAILVDASANVALRRSYVDSSALRHSTCRAIVALAYVAADHVATTFQRSCFEPKHVTRDRAAGD